MSTTRSGWLVYAATMMFIAAGLEVIWALNLWADAAWVANVSGGILGGHRWLWGFIDAGLAIMFVYAGKSLLDGKSFGRWIALIAASIAMFRWFYWMAFTPFLGMTVVAMMFLVIYGVLTTWGTED